MNVVILGQSELNSMAKALISSLAIMQLVTVPAMAQDATCNLWQVCSNHGDDTPEGTSPTTDCEDPSDVTVPVFVSGNFAPGPITLQKGINDLASACPFLDPTDNLCCNSDTATIMGKQSIRIIQYYYKVSISQRFVCYSKSSPILRHFSLTLGAFLCGHHFFDFFAFMTDYFLLHISAQLRSA